MHLSKFLSLSSNNSKSIFLGPEMSHTKKNLSLKKMNCIFIQIQKY